MSNDNNKFKNGKIYTIRYKNDDTLIYVGATVQPLYKRLSAHKKDSKNPKCENFILYKKMNETDINDWYIELYEDCVCERKEQLNKREGEIIRQIGTLNKNIAGRTKKEYSREYDKKRDKDKLKNKNSNYYLKNKDIINEKHHNNRLKKKLEKEEANIITIS
jgi:hypothetical protein